MAYWWTTPLCMQMRFDGERGTQMVRIPTNEDDVYYDVELNIISGLAYFQMQPPTPEQLNDETIPHVHLTSNMAWDPAKYDDKETPRDNTFEVNEAMATDTNNAYNCEVFFQQMASLDPSGTSWDMDDDDFYEFDEMELNDYLDTAFTMIPNVIAALASVTRNLEAKLTHVEHKYGKTLDQLRPHFAWASTNRVKATMEASTQFFRATQWSKN
jgi:hypothetical protein